VLGLDFSQARNLALVGAVGFAVAAIVSLWLIKSIVQKLVLAALLGLLAFATWSQRTSLDQCVEQVRARVDLEVAGAPSSATTCTFFGVDVTVS
jgi:hypothetical protein